MKSMIEMMKRRSLLRWSIIAVLFCCSLSAQMVRTDSLFSASVERMKSYTLVLPQGYSAAQRYPLLVLLHGWGGDHTNWTKIAHVERHLGPMPAIILMPDGENSWYVDSFTDERARHEGAIMRDLLPYIMQRYSVDTGRLAIAGLSMGGYGALVLGLRHPEFRFIAPLSGSLDIPNGIPDLRRNNRRGLEPSIVSAFGSSTSEFWKEHDPVQLVLRLKSSEAPYFYLANGIQDEFPARLGYYRAFADTLRVHGIAYEYHETPGRHNWAYWEREIIGVLAKLKEIWKL